MYKKIISTISYPLRSNVKAIRTMSIKTSDMQTLEMKISDDEYPIKEPYHQFKIWLDEICKAKKVMIPYAMCLSTATKNAAPSARIMILRAYGKEGFKFCTYYDSRKGKQLEQNPQAALTFFWDAHFRSVRIEGKVEKLDLSYAKDCFYKSQKDSQITTLGSKQDTVISGKNIIIEKEKELSAKYKDCEVPLPPLWGGYILIPEMIEFWQGQSDKLHDRIRFRRPTPNEKIDGVLVHQGEDGWVFERLSP